MNVFTVVGRITADADLRYTANQSPVCGFTVATDVGFGEKKHPIYVRCSLWGRRGESLAPHLLKGSPVTVSGEADLRQWETPDKRGAEITLNVNEVALQGSKPARATLQAAYSEPAVAQRPVAPLPDDVPF